MYPGLRQQLQRLLVDFVVHLVLRELDLGIGQPNVSRGAHNTSDESIQGGKATGSFHQSVSNIDTLARTHTRTHQNTHILVEISKGYT